MAKVNAKRLSQVSTSSAFDSCVEFDSKEASNVKELDEMKARIAQMEKSMRWWNQCANNWRLKWTQVRNERNKLKDECRSIKNKLEDFESKCSSLEIELESLRTLNTSECTTEHEFFQRTPNNCKIETCVAAAIPDKMEPPYLDVDNTDQSSFFDECVDLSKLSFDSLIPNENDEGPNVTTKKDVSTDTSDLNVNSSAYNCDTVDCERLSDLKHAHKQLKKVLQEKCVELTNALRKVDTYENEIKKLRLRTDELRKQLVVAEDHADNASNTIRKLQRSNDKLQEQVNDFRVGMHANVRRDESRELNVNAIEK